MLLIPAVRSSKADVVGAKTSKAQEDLAKARKLIKSMRSLEKSASKCSQSSTEDIGQRLHQVACPSSRDNHKEGSHRFVKSLESRNIVIHTNL